MVKKMQIEYTEDESRIRWERDGEWKSADLDELIEAYEAEPKHGRWVVSEGTLGGYAVLHCKKCGTTFNYVPSWKYHYCPNCGARMDGGENDNN